MAATKNAPPKSEKGKTVHGQQKTKHRARQKEGAWKSHK